MEGLAVLWFIATAVYALLWLAIGFRLAQAHEELAKHFLWIRNSMEKVANSLEKGGAGGAAESGRPSTAP